MTTLPLGRVIDLQTTKADRANDFKVGLEHIEAKTGRLIDAEADYTGDGVAFEPDDVLFGKLRPYLAKVWCADRPGNAVGDFHVYRPRPGLVDPRYLIYALLSDSFIGPVTSSVYGAKMPRASWDFIRTLAIHLPPLEHQSRLAGYLDRETAQIDALIAKQEQLIATLRERRAGVIAQEALREFDPLDPSGTSGPSLGTVFDVSLGKMLDAKKEPGSEDLRLPYVRAANIQDDGLDLLDVNRMWFSPAEAARLDIRDGDLLVVEGGAVGTTVLVNESMPGWSFQKTVNRVRATSDWSTAWLRYVLRAYRDVGIIDLICDGSTIAHLTAEKLRALRIPPIAPGDQQRIVNFLDATTAKIDALIAKAERFIELSKERRAALITAAVTGQLNIPV